MTLVFRRLGRTGVLGDLRRGALDEAPVPLGDVGLFRADPATLHVRPLLAIDLMTFRRGAVTRQVRRAYWQTADRSDYEALVAEDGATATSGLVGQAVKSDPAGYRGAVRSIPSLPHVAVRITVPPDPTLQYGVRILYAQWRAVELGPQLVPTGGPADADFRRVAADYPQDEALLGALGLPAALGHEDQRAAFDRLDARLRSSARVVPICWVADARWVSTRLRGWSQDVLGDVDYTAVSVRP